MTKQNQNPDPSKGSLLEFPCRFPIKAMGRADGNFDAVVVQIIRRHAELWADEEQPVASNPSSAGKYISVTVVIEATSQAQLDAIYQDLTESPDVLMAL